MQELKDPTAHAGKVVRTTGRLRMNFRGALEFMEHAGYTVRDYEDAQVVAAMRACVAEGDDFGESAINPDRYLRELAMLSKSIEEAR